MVSLYGTYPVSVMRYLPDCDPNGSLRWTAFVVHECNYILAHITTRLVSQITRDLLASDLTIAFSIAPCGQKHHPHLQPRRAESSAVIVNKLNCLSQLLPSFAKASRPVAAPTARLLRRSQTTGTFPLARTMPTRTQEVSSEAGPSKQSSSQTSPLKRQSSASTQQLKLPPILPLSDFPETAEPKHTKAAGYDFYRNVLGSPKRIVAPMVSGSEYPWRILSNKLGAELCYSPMINSRSLTDNLRAKGATAREHALAWFNTESGEEGHGDDQKLIVQLAGDDPALILQAAESVQDHCLGIDLNLGCPQHIAKRGHYGAFLQEDWHLIFDIISNLHRNLKVPVTAKMRVFPDVERTVAYAQMLERAGAQIVTCHGRTREQKGHLSGLADWEKIKAVKEALKVPVFANGNVLYREDVDACLETAGVDGVMSAEGNLYNPALFASESVLDKLPSELLPHRRGVEGSPEVAVRRDWAEFPYIPALAHMYLDEVAKCQHKVDKAAVKGHIFKICRPALAKHPDLRPSIGKAMLAYPGDKRAAKETDSVHEDESLPEGERVVKQYRDIMRELDGRLQVSDLTA